MGLGIADQNFGRNNHLANSIVPGFPVTLSGLSCLPGVLISHSVFQHPLSPVWSRPVSLGVAVGRDIAMSLTSRVFGLFSTANSDSTATPAGHLSTSTWPHSTHLAVPSDYSSHVRDGDFTAMEEESRPPYLHVRHSSMI